ncbi:hypothetical protein GE061_014491 [Apolygus lucorum]|uniref:Uncharacterized protein n=1 Tax=Apolygus lucorum TaxID=248454 RepID=A0A6A4JC67_APOLU|nr:hypothetical protein GE061_014491 [Apolygus lucorum]
MSSTPQARKPIMRYLGSTRNSISLEWEWEGSGDSNSSFKVQIEDQVYEWITKYWGKKKKTTIKELGPGELYRTRVGVAQLIGEDIWGDELWSDTVIFATQLDLPWTFYLFQNVQQNAAANVVAFSKKRNSCLDVYNKYGDTPLILAIRERKEGVVESLVENGADVAQPGKALRKTPLMVACFGGYKAAAEALVNRGVDWNVFDSNKCQALHYAVDGGKLEMVRYGIECGANVNAQDRFGWTPLMRGVLIGCSLPILTLLIENGADVNLKDQNKMRALDLARLLGGSEMKELLEQYTEPEEDKTKEDESLAHQEETYNLEDERDVEAKREEDEEREVSALMKTIDEILGMPVEDDKLLEDDHGFKSMDQDDEGQLPSEI